MANDLEKTYKRRHDNKLNDTQNNTKTLNLKTHSIMALILMTLSKITAQCHLVK